MPLNILVIGAGIAGLSAAVSLSRTSNASHRITILEKSAFARETGAALALAPNGARVLHALGFSFERSRAVPLTWWETVDGVSLAKLSSVDLTESEKKYGQPTWTVHRVDFHGELLRVAGMGDEREGEKEGKEEGRVLKGGAGKGGEGGEVEMRLGKQVVDVDAEAGTVRLLDGTELKADLIVGADGVRSTARDAVVSGHVKQEEIEKEKSGEGGEKKESGRLRTGMSAFRFLIPTEKLQADERLRELLSWKVQGASLFIDPVNPSSQRHAVWYGCRGGEVQNLVGLHPTRPNANYETEDLKSLLLDEFKHFHPDLVTLFRFLFEELLTRNRLTSEYETSHAEDVSCWPLYDYDPLPSWSRGKTVLIGDAAHPMLPLGGQAANQALEDAGALGYLFADVDKPDQEQITQRLALFDQVRRKRGSMIQVLSSVLVGREAEARERIEPFVEEGFLGEFRRSGIWSEVGMSGRCHGVYERISTR